MALLKQKNVEALKDLEKRMSLGGLRQCHATYFFVVVIVINPSRPNPRRRVKIKLSSYVHTSLWCLKRFYEGLKGIKGINLLMIYGMPLVVKI